MKTAMDYFNDIQIRYSLDDIAINLGLHKNTLVRWQEKNSVPDQYIGDIKRILGDRRQDDLENKDQFYTKPEIASKCLHYFMVALDQLDIDYYDYVFIEPSAGEGAFYDLMPTYRRIGMDIEPRSKGVITRDFLQWKPQNDKKYLVLGNPPFGLRGHLALQFINHSYTFADVIGFILPKLFDSDGKGVPAKRVIGYHRVSSHILPSDSFYSPDRKDVAIHTTFQVWTKINASKIIGSVKNKCGSYIKIFSLSDGGTPYTTRNKNMIGKCDVYIPSTCFSGMGAYTSFDDLPNRRGYGVAIYRDREEIKQILLTHNWEQSAFYSTNSALNIRKSLIEDVIIQAGFFDKRLV